MSKTIIFIICLVFVIAAVTLTVYAAVPRQTMAYVDSFYWERSTVIYNSDTKKTRTVTASGDNHTPYWPTYELGDTETVDHTEQKYVAYISVDGERPEAITMSQTNWENLTLNDYIPAYKLYSM